MIQEEVLSNVALSQRDQETNITTTIGVGDGVALQLIDQQIDKLIDLGLHLGNEYKDKQQYSINESLKFALVLGGFREGLTSLESKFNGIDITALRSRKRANSHTW